LFTQNMLEMSLQLAIEDPSYQDLAVKFLEHFVWIASSMNRLEASGGGMWDETDGFFYDIIRFPDGSTKRLQVRSMVRLLPLCATTVYSEETLLRLPEFAERARWFGKHRPELFKNMHPPGAPGYKGRRMLSLLNEGKLRRVLARLLDPKEFLSDYG